MRRLLAILGLLAVLAAAGCGHSAPTAQSTDLSGGPAGIGAGGGLPPPPPPPAGRR